MKHTIFKDILTQVKHVTMFQNLLAIDIRTVKEDKVCKQQRRLSEAKINN